MEEYNMDNNNVDNNNIDNNNLNNNLVDNNQGILDNERQKKVQMENQVFEEVKNQNDVDNKKERKIKKKEYKISKSQKVIYYILGVLEILFAFRFVFKILGANTESAFVSFIYSSSNLLLAPFTGIFRMAVTEGIETKSFLEPTLIIGMIVYALLAWGIVKLIQISSQKGSENI